MLVNRIAKALFNVSKREIVPKAPRLTSGELEPFRLEAENAQLYDGYTLDELYGVKMGAKHPPAVKAEMMKYGENNAGTISRRACSSSSAWASSSTLTTSSGGNWRRSRACSRPSTPGRLSFDPQPLFLLSIMQPEEPTASLPSSHYWALLHMYHSMTALELKKEKIKIIQDLEQLNTIVTELVMGENEALCAIEDLDREVSRQNKLRLTLEKSLDSFSYMLTGDYNVQLEEELARSKKKLKMLK